MTLGPLDLKSSGSKIKEAEHDAVRNPLTLFGVAL